MNSALDAAPVLTLGCFCFLDAGSALCLWGALEALQAPVDADFVLAYALSKAVRVQRLPLDAAAAGALARAWPALAAVRVSRLVDAAAALPGRLWALLPQRLWVLRRRDLAVPAEPASKRVLSRAAEEARRLADAYGLAYMAAKNVIGPVSIVLIYAALRRGMDLQSWLAALGGGAAGRSASRLALASWTSVLLFPLVVLGAAHLSLRLHRLLARLRGESVMAV